MAESRSRSDLDGQVEAAGFPCVELVEPTASDLEDLSDRFALHELAIEDAVKAHQRPKLERYGENLFLVLKTAHYDDEAETVEVGEVQLLFGPDFLVIIRHDSDHPLDLKSDRAPNLEEEGPGVMVHRIIDQVVDGYAPVIDGFEVDTREVEKTVFSMDLYPTERIYRLKGQLLYFLHNTRPLVEPLAELSKGRNQTISQGLAEYMRDVEDHLRRVVGRIERSSDLMSEMLDANLAQVSLRQNEDMRKISAWGAVFLLPTVLAGIWGMNFVNMPEIDWVFGYPVALAIMVAGSIILHWRLRKAGWL